MFKKQIEKPTPIEEEKETNIPEEVGTSHIVYGELEEVEVINWDEAFKQHLEESARLQQEIDERLEAQNKKKQSWELLRTCVDFIKTNEKIWKIEEEERLTVRQRKERLNKKNQLEKKFKETAKEKETTTKITKIWQRLPEHEKRHLLKEEEKRQRLEIREIKVNIWKKWRKESVKQRKENEERHKTNQEKWLETLEETMQRLKREVEESKKARKMYEQRRENLLKENKRKQEEILRKKQETKERKEKKRMLEERWAMTRWLTSYIDENQEKWKTESEDRQKNEKKRAAEWHKMERFEKIRIVKEKLQENKKVTMKMQPAKMTPRSDKPEEQADAKYQEQEEYDDHESQAEQPGRPGEVPPSQEPSHQHGQGDQDADDAQADADDQAASQSNQPSLPSSPSRSPLPNSVQSLTIQRAVLRCVTVHDKSILDPILTPNKPGTMLTETHKQRESQAGHQHSSPVDRGLAEQPGVSQAELPGGPADAMQPQDQEQPDVQGGDQAGRADEPDDQPRLSTFPQKSVQSLTIPRAVLRCLPVQQNNNCATLLTSSELGTTTLDTHQAEQNLEMRENQASPQCSLTIMRDQCDQAEQIIQKPYPHAAGGTLDPATPIQTPNQREENPNPNLIETQDELNPMAHACAGVAELNKATNATPVELNHTAPAAATNPTKSNPTAPLAELNTAATAETTELNPEVSKFNHKTHTPVAGGTRDPATSNPTPTASLAKPNTVATAALAELNTNPCTSNPNPTTTKLNNDKFATTPTKQVMFSTPKRKRSPQDKPKVTPKFPRLQLPTLKQPNLEKTKPEKIHPHKPNPHPHWNQNQFVKIDAQLQLLKHSGLAKTTKKIKTKPKPNPLETTKPTHHQEPTVTPTPTNPQRRPSNNFTKLAKIFQQHTPPPRHTQRNQKPIPKPDAEKPDHLIRNQSNQCESKKKPDVILTSSKLYCSSQSYCSTSGVNTKNSPNFENPPNEKFRQTPPKNYLTSKNPESLIGQCQDGTKTQY